MLFNSDEFILGFLPVSFLGFYLLRTASRTWAIRWIIFVSLFFYAWWRPFNVLLIAPSILVNFVIAKALLRLGRDERNALASKLLLVAGVAFNVAFLGYFKYLNFFSQTLNDVFGTNLIISQIVLPLGISFITFQKIAFLIDVHGRRVNDFTLEDYCLFVLFFPQLIAGPIVHYLEIMPQFKGDDFRVDRTNLAVGATLFFAGLFKKCVLADGIALLVTPIYAHAGHDSISFVLAWMAAVGFTLQLYFDFSGYTDMALGAARIFGIRLPPNFDSPLQAPSIIEFWQRWHMTLTRFLTAYIYNPIVLWLTRRRLAANPRVALSRKTTIGTMLYLVAVPTIFTMFVSGVWHGAGYTFVIWGLLHGLYLTINHAWRRLCQKRGWINDGSQGSFAVASVALTFVSVAISMVFFRSATVKSALNIIAGLFGFNGFSLPEELLSRWGGLGRKLQAIGVVSDQWSERDFLSMAIWIPALLIIAMAAPNMLQLLERYQPALGEAGHRPHWLLVGTKFRWMLSAPYAVAVAAAAVLGIAFLGSYSEFLYWQF
jgi:alginate O-acetyltransferase complex protein AlgI